MQITKNDSVISLNLTKSFNRYVLTYTASSPVRCTLTYAEGDGERSEEFFLEAGENRTFSSYMDGFLLHKTATAALSMTARTITHEAGEFILHGFSVRNGLSNLFFKTPRFSRLIMQARVHPFAPHTALPEL